MTLFFANRPDSADAFRMLQGLSGRRHEVVTAVTVARGNWRESRRVISTVTFSHLPEEVIQAYCETPEPYDKAGAYGIQGFGDRS